MLATHEKDTTLTGLKVEQESQMSPNVGPTFTDMLPKCRLTRQCRVEIANADIRQTQLSYVTALNLKLGQIYHKIGLRRIQNMCHQSSFLRPVQPQEIMENNRFS